MHPRSLDLGVAGARGRVGCGGRVPDIHGTTHPYMAASPGCWQRYGELLARSYSWAEYRPVHQLIVDTYIGQHCTGTSRREVQTLALCLMTLCLFVEDDADPRDGGALHKEMMADRPDYFHWLQPPPHLGQTTVAEVLAARDTEEHQEFTWAWGREVWAVWAPHHATVRDWNARALTRSRPCGGARTMSTECPTIR